MNTVQHEPTIAEMFDVWELQRALVGHSDGDITLQATQRWTQLVAALRRHAEVIAAWREVERTKNPKYPTGVSDVESAEIKVGQALLNVLRKDHGGKAL